MAKPVDYLLPSGMGECNSWRVHWGSQLSWMPEDFLQELWDLKAQSYQKDLIAGRRQGCVQFPNALRACGPTDLSRVEMGLSMRKGSLLLVTVLATKGHRNADTVGKQVSVWFFTENTVF